MHEVLGHSPFGRHVKLRENRGSGQTTMMLFEAQLFWKTVSDSILIVSKTYLMANHLKRTAANLGLLVGENARIRFAGVDSLETSLRGLRFDAVFIDGSVSLDDPRLLRYLSILKASNPNMIAN